MESAVARPTTTSSVNRYYVSFALIIALFVGYLALGYITKAPLVSDNHQNIRIAYHLVHTGVWGYNSVETPAPRPQIRREPLPILGIAAVMIFDPAFNGTYKIADVAEGRLVTRIKIINVIWAALLTLAIFLLVGELFSYSYKGAIIALVTALPTAYFMSFRYVDRMMTEVPASFFMLLAAWLGIRFVRNRSTKNAIALGIALGLLTLVKAAALYIGLCYIALLFLVQASRQSGGIAGSFSRLNLIRYALIAVAMAATISPWVIRNIYTFRTPVVTSRGGDILAFRALLTEQPFSVSLYLFTPESYRPMVGKLLGGAPNSEAIANFKGLKKARWDIYRERMAAAGERYRGSTRSGPWLSRQALGYFAEHPVRYALSGLLFGYRGIWFMNAAAVPNFIAMGAFLTWFNVLSFITFVALSIWALIRRDPVLVAFTGLAFGSFVFYSLLSHNIVRYSDPITPFVFISLYWWLDVILRALKQFSASLVPTHADGG